MSWFLAIFTTVLGYVSACAPIVAVVFLILIWKELKKITAHFGEEERKQEKDMHEQEKSVD